MSNICFKNDKSYIDSYGMTSKAEYTPLYFVKNGKRYFIHNQIKELDNHDGYRDYHNEQNIKETEKLKAQLINNNGQYITFYAEEQNIEDFINWIKENNLTFRDDLTFF